MDESKPRSPDTRNDYIPDHLLPPDPDAPEGAEGEETLAKSNVIGFILVPLMLVLVVVGIVWTFWYLTYDKYTLTDYATLLQDKNKSVRWQAALDMVQNNQASPELLPIIEEMLRASNEDQKVDQKTWTNDILKSPEERTVNLRWYAAAALGKIGGERARDLLLPLLKDEDAGVRFYAAHSLGRMREPQAADPLIELLKNDPDPGTRMTAAWALGEIGDPRLKQSDPEMPKKIQAALLEGFQKDSSSDVRMNSAIALARFGEPSIRTLLLDMTKMDNAHTRDQARQALMMLNEREAKKTNP